MINPTSKNLVKLSRLSSSDPPNLSQHRSSAPSLKQRKPPLHNNTNSLTTNNNTTHDHPLLSQCSLTNRLNAADNTLIHDSKQALYTDRSLIKQSRVGITTIANFSGIISSQEKDKKKMKRAKTQALSLVRPSSSVPASFRKLGERLSTGEIVNDENIENKEEKEVRKLILKDIPRMKDMSSIMMNTARDIKAKFRKIDSMTKLDFSQTFRSKFEDEVVADVMSKVEEQVGLVNKGDKTRVVKLNCEERFIIEQDKKVYFKMKTDNVKFPLDVRIGFLPKTAHYFFELYVSSTNTMPSLSRYDHRIVDEKEFVLRYAKHPAQLYFTLYAISEVDLKMHFSVLKEKEEEGEVKKGKQRLNHWEYFRKAMEHMKAKRTKEYEFMKYSAEQLNRFNAEVAEIKREKVLKNLALTRDGRNIVKCNMNELYATHPDIILTKIRHQSEEREIKTENAQRKKGELQNEKQTRKVLLVNRVGIKREARKAYLQIFQEEEFKKEIQRRWIATVAKRLFFENLFERIRAKRIEEFTIRMRNKKIARFQQAFRRHLQKRGPTRLERNILNFREGLEGAANLVSKGVTEMAGKALTKYIKEAGILIGFQLKMERLWGSVLRLQRAFRRRRFRWYMRKLAVMSIILDIVKDRPMDRFKTGKLPVKKNKKKDKKDNNVHLQFYSCLQSNNEFQRYVVEYIVKCDKIQHVEDDKEYMKLICADKKKKLKKKGGNNKTKETTKEENRTIETRLSKNIPTISNPLSTFSDSFVPASSRSRSHSGSSISSTSSRQSFDQKKEKPETVMQNSSSDKFVVEGEAIDKRTLFKMPNKASVQLLLETEAKVIVKEALGRVSLNYFAKKPSFISYFV